MDAAVSGAVPQFRNAAGRQVMLAGGMEPALDAKVKTALILASVALAFFIGAIVRHWLW